MGLIKKAFGAIVNLVAAIFKGILGIVGIGQKSEYYLELDESQAEAQSAANPAPAAKPEPTQTEMTASQPSPAETSEVKPSEAKRVVQASAPASQSKSAVTQPSGMALASAKADPKAAGTFATDYLVNPRLSSGGRRRPGPCLTSFKDMARQMQSPARG